MGRRPGPTTSPTPESYRGSTCGGRRRGGTPRVTCPPRPTCRRSVGTRATVCPLPPHPSPLIELFRAGKLVSSSAQILWGVGFFGVTRHLLYVFIGHAPRATGALLDGLPDVCAALRLSARPSPLLVARSQTRPCTTPLSSCFSKEARLLIPSDLICRHVRSEEKRSATPPSERRLRLAPREPRQLPPLSRT